jgi:general nucleoside transport system ATP-binding protein
MNPPIEVPRLRIDHITKSFPGVLANADISLSVFPGEIHALLGENGAGKTTLMNVVYGLLPPDSGDIYIDDQRIAVHSPKDAIRHRIGMVHQHFMLVPTLTVAENILLGMRPLATHLLDMRAVENDIATVAQKYGMAVRPGELVSHLSVGEQQRVEIVKALYRGIRLLILDEPTAVLTPQETTELFKTLKGLTGQGLSIVFITHKLGEVLRIADRVTVLRDGRWVATKPVKETNQNELAFLMVDRAVSFSHQRPDMVAGKFALAVENLTVRSKERKPLNGVSFQVRGGEILGLAGVDGNGQHELALALTGLLRPSAGKITLNGRDATGWSVRQLNEAGLGHVPADRQTMGVALDFSVADNLILQRYYQPPFTTAVGLLSPRAIADYARRLVGAFDIRTPSTDTKLCNLSGGNQQKVILAREIDRKPQVLIAVQPTRGLDIGATEYIHKLLLEERSRGAAILLISTELEEVMELSDRIVVMYDGRLVGEVPGGRADVLKIGRMMAGLKEQEAETTAPCPLAARALVPVGTLELRDDI